MFLNYRTRSLATVTRFNHELCEKKKEKQTCFQRRFQKHFRIQKKKNPRVLLIHKASTNFRKYWKKNIWKKKSIGELRVYSTRWKHPRIHYVLEHKSNSFQKPIYNACMLLGLNHFISRHIWPFNNRQNKSKHLSLIIINNSGIQPTNKFYERLKVMRKLRIWIKKTTVFAEKKHG